MENDDKREYYIKTVCSLCTKCNNCEKDSIYIHDIFDKYSIRCPNYEYKNSVMIGDIID